jgi:hypothetical protein
MADINERIKAAKALLTPAVPGSKVTLDPTDVSAVITDLNNALVASQTAQKSLKTTVTEKEDEILKLNNQLSTIDCSSPVEINTFLANNDRLGFERKYQELSKRVRDAIHKSTPDKKPVLRKPTVTEELEYWRKTGENEPGRDRNHDMKALSAISDFSGGSESLWRAFEHPWIVAIRNRAITENDLRTTLFQKLKGTAAIFYLSIAGIETMSFGEIMEVLREKYTSDPLTAMNKISGMTQKPSESVEDFAARMIVEGKGSMPSAPAELAVLMAGTQNFVMPNPLREEETVTFKQRLSESQAKLTNAFLRGLRPDITSRMTSEKYTTFEQVKKAAESAEWMKDSIQTGMIHTLNVGVNAMNIRGQDRFKNKDQNQQKSDACFRCGKTGHWAAECRYPVATGAPTGQAHFQKSKPAFNKRSSPQRGRGGFRGRSRPVKMNKNGTNLPWNPRDPRRRKWMVRRRVGLNRKMQFKRRNFHLTGEPAANSFTEDEIDLAQLEGELEPEEFEQYQLEVAEFDETYADESESDYEDDSKN